MSIIDNFNLIKQNVNSLKTDVVLKNDINIVVVTKTIPSDKFWKAAIVFIMPSSAGKWTLNMAFHNHKTFHTLEDSTSEPSERFCISPRLVRIYHHTRTLCDDHSHRFAFF